MNEATAPIKKAQKIDSVFDCPRCDAKGFIDAFRHIASGRCFLCGGAKTISMKKKYPRNDKMVCVVKKGICNWYNDDFSAVNRVYKELIQIWTNGGEYYENGRDAIVFQRYIEDSNREMLKNVWRWCKANNFEMRVINEDSPEV